jgi:ABC-type Fe3+ transport system substrate-binding protein
MINRRVMKQHCTPHFSNSSSTPTLTRRALGAATLLALSGLWLAGCGQKNSPTSSTGTTGGATGSAQTLQIISPHGEEIKNEFTRLWKQKHPDVEVRWIDKGASSNALRFVKDQFKRKPGGIGIDLFFGGGAETFVELEEDGVLQALPKDYDVPADISGTPLRGKDNAWVAAALSGFGILYNKSSVQKKNLPLPKTWSDLGNPKLRDEIEMADPRHSGSAHAAYEIILQANGWEEGWKVLSLMAANSRKFTRSASDLPQDVSSGEVSLAPSIDFYARSSIAKAGEAKLGYITPSGQNVVTPDPIGILKGAPNAELAQQWVEFVMSPAAQKLWMLAQGTPGGPTENSLYRQPALPSLYKSMPANSLIKENPFAIKNARAYDAAKAAKRRRALDELIGAALIDNHDAIRAKWAKNTDPKTVAYVPLSEDELMQAAEKWDDAAFQTQTVSAWSEAAEKYFQ